jgi:hypothetical protein
MEPPRRSDHEGEHGGNNSEPDGLESAESRATGRPVDTQQDSEGNETKTGNKDRAKRNVTAPASNRVLRDLRLQLGDCYWLHGNDNCGLTP